MACSGAYTGNIRIGGTKQYADELVQSDSLAIKARNTRIKMVLLVAGANDDLQFGPVMTDCVERYLLLQGPCQSKYQPGWQARVDALVPKVEATVSDLKTVMRDAGYADGSYKLVVMGYPSPIGPDFHDNPSFPGKLVCGGLGYDSDTVWGRDTAVPAFEVGMRKAAEATGATYLDDSRLFNGHEVCMEDTWARGLYIDVSKPGLPDAELGPPVLPPQLPGSRRLRLLPHPALQLRCQGRQLRRPRLHGQPRTLYPLAWDDAYRPLKNEATGSCADVTAANSANGTAVIGWDCHGGRNQGWWYDDGRKSVHTQLTQDRCLDVPGANYTAGAQLIIWNCSGAANQEWVRASGTLRPAAATSLCATLGAAKDPLTLRPCDGTASQRFA